jgi:hypothetical protein
MDGALDSLQIYERLRSAKLNDKSAKEIAAIFQQVSFEQAVTKRDIAQLRADLELKIEQSKNGVIIWVAGLMAAQVGILAALYKLIR